MISAELPLEIRTVLRTVAWRQWSFQLLSLVMTVVAGTVGTVLVWLLVDAFCNLPPLMRAAGKWTAFAVFLTLTGRSLWKWFTNRLDDAELARRIDRTFPELQERFSTCLDVLSQPPPRTRMERWFRAQLKRETVPHLDTLRPERVIVDSRPAWGTIVLFILAVGAMIPQVWWGDGYAHLWSRWERPWDNLGWGRLAAIDVAPRDWFALRDRDFHITATLTHYRSSTAAEVPLTVHWRSIGDRTWQARTLQSCDTGRASGVIPHVPRDVEWYVTTPGVESPRSLTRVIDPPQIVALTAMIDPPGYTREVSRHTSVAGDLAVLAGSRLHFTFVCDRALKQAALLWPDDDNPNGMVLHPVTLTHHGMRGTVNVVATTTGPMTLRLTTPQGLILDDPPRSLTVRSDQPPVVQLEGPASLTLRPDDRHEIVAHSVDDFGLTTMELHIELTGQSAEPIAQPLPSGTTTAELRRVIDLLPWTLSPGTSVALRVRALDNREHPSPQEGWSAPQVIVISPSAVSNAERRLADNTRQSRNELGEIIQQLEDERTRLRDVHQKTAAAAVRQKPAEQDERLKEIAAGHEELQHRLIDFAAMLPDDEPGEALRQETEQVTSSPLEAAAEKLAATPKLAPRDQIPTLSQALDDLAAAKKALQKIDDALIARSALGDDLKTLQQLANRSDRLAEQMPTSPQDTTEPLKRKAGSEVQKIRDELSQIVQRRPEWQAALQQAEQTARPPSALSPENRPQRNGQPRLSGPVPEDAGAALSQARQQLTTAQAQLSPTPSDNGSGAPPRIALQAAARALRAAVEKTAGPASTSEPGSPSSNSTADAGRGQPQPGEAGEAGARGENAMLTEFTRPPANGTSNRNWGRLSAGLNTEILQGSQRPAHGDYAREVRRYFERIAQPLPPADVEGTP